MHNNLGKVIKATIIDLIVALLIISLFYGSINFVFGQEIKSIFSMANLISVNTSEKKPKVEMIYKDKVITHYPEYGAKYATIQIPAIDVDLPVYFGDTLNILKNGVGHSSGSYFPGEGGSIIYMGHNSKNVFRRFSELKKGDQIYVKTSYGKFTYKIYDMQIVNEYDTDKLPIQQDEEKLMVYTCYPFVNIGHATERYVVYANLTNTEESEADVNENSN